MSNISDVILHPNIFNTSRSNVSLELWNRGNTVTTVYNNIIHKTIYSSSPSNYLEPKSAAYTGCTASGTYNNGWNLYCSPNSQGSTVFFAALGNRTPNAGTIVDIGSGGGGFYWLAGPNDASHAYYMDFRSNYVYTNYINTRAYGFSLRSTSEQ